MPDILRIGELELLGIKKLMNLQSASKPLQSYAF